MRKKDGKVERVDIDMLVREELKRFRYVKQFRDTLMDTRPKDRHRRYFSSKILEQLQGQQEEYSESSPDKTSTRFYESAMSSYRKDEFKLGGVSVESILEKKTKLPQALIQKQKMSFHQMPKRGKSNMLAQAQALQRNQMAHQNTGPFFNFRSSCALPKSKKMTDSFQPFDPAIYIDERES